MYLQRSVDMYSLLEDNDTVQIKYLLCYKNKIPIVPNTLDSIINEIKSYFRIIYIYHNI